METQCEVCGHGTRRLADSCWEAQQRMQRAEEQAKAAAVEVAALREELAERKKYWDAKTAAMENSALRRENEQARALLARVELSIGWDTFRTLCNEARAFLDPPPGGGT